jgi:hypothetical protein
LRPYVKQASATSAAVRARKADDLAADMAHDLCELREAGVVMLRDLAEGLNARGRRAMRGSSWSAEQVRRVLKQVEAA